MTVLNEKVDIYVRLSDEDRDKRFDDEESESIQNQKNLLIDYCRQRGWEIHAIYSDEDFSGADRHRPGWNCLLEDCRLGRCTVVLCKTQSRFSRDMEMIETYLHGRFREWGVRFISVVDHADTAVSGNKKARQINGLINEWYLDDLSENIKATLGVKRKRGEFVGAFAPYGYMVDPADHNHLIVDEVAAAVVRRIFALYAQGYGYIAIAKALNAEGVSSPYERKKELGLRYYNANAERSAGRQLWTDGSVYTVLRRREYTGAVVQGRETVVNYKTGARRRKEAHEWDIVDGRHEAIVSAEEFERVQQLRCQRGRGQKIPSGQCHPLARRVFCGECGATLWKTSYESGGERRQYLSCRTRKTACGQCDNRRQIRLDQLETFVLSQLNALLTRYYDPSHRTTVRPSRTTPPVERALGREIEEHTQALRLTEDRLQRAYIDSLDGVLSAEEFAAFRDRLRGEQQHHRERLALLQTQREVIGAREEETVMPTFLPAVCGKFDRLTLSVAAAFLVRVDVGAVGPDHTRTVRITWAL